jgi:hypothetical protein
MYLFFFYHSTDGNTFEMMRNLSSDVNLWYWFLANKGIFSMHSLDDMLPFCASIATHFVD